MFFYFYYFFIMFMSLAFGMRVVVVGIIPLHSTEHLHAGKNWREPTLDGQYLVNSSDYTVVWFAISTISLSVLIIFMSLAFVMGVRVIGVIPLHITHWAHDVVSWAQWENANCSKSYNPRLWSGIYSQSQRYRSQSYDWSRGPSPPITCLKCATPWFRVTHDTHWGIGHQEKMKIRCHCMFHDLVRE